MRVLITGAAGAIGSRLVKGLSDRHQLRGLDCVGMEAPEDAIVGDIGDLDLLLEATEGMEAVIHLVSVTGGDEWSNALKSKIGMYNTFEAARRNGVRRIAVASRAGVLSRAYYGSTRRTPDMLPKPGNLYTITKIFAESIGYMYATRYDMEVVALRIGNFHRDRDQPTHPHHLSYGDCVRVFEQAITHPGVRYEAVFAVSDNDWPLYDLEHGRQAINYHPQDRSHVPEEERVW